MKLLPQWVLTHLKPGFYDVESGTTIEQTAKVYKAMNELIEEYNTFVDNWNTRIEEFNSGVISDNEAFRIALRQEFQDFIDVVALKVTELEHYAKNTISSELEQVFKEISASDEVKAIITEGLQEFNHRLEEISKQINDSVNESLTNMNTEIANLRESVNNVTPTLFNLTFNPTTLEVTFNDGQTASQLFELVTNEKPIKVRYSTAVGYVELFKKHKLSVLGKTGYQFEGEIGLEKVVYQLTEDNFKHLSTYSTPDYVVELGSFDDWTYRKWASGIAECWAEFGFWNEPISNESIKRLRYNKAFPFEFVDVPAVFAVASSVPDNELTNGYPDFCVINAVASTTQLQTVSVIGYTSLVTITEGFISIHANGRWK